MGRRYIWTELREERADRSVVIAGVVEYKETDSVCNIVILNDLEKKVGDVRPCVVLVLYWNCEKITHLYAAQPAL